MEDKKDGAVVWVARRRGISTCQNSGFRFGVEEDISRYTNDFSTEQVLNKKFYFDQSETPAFVLWRECKLVSLRQLNFAGTSGAGRRAIKWNCMIVLYRAATAGGNPKQSYLRKKKLGLLI
ncbi:unnamed protein product [Camellia sinensis]